MNIGLKFRDAFAGSLGHIVREELDQLVATLQQHWLVGHNVDGSHSNAIGDDAGDPVGSRYLRDDMTWVETPFADVDENETITGTWTFTTLPVLGTLTGYLKGTAGSLSAVTEVPGTDVALSGTNGMVAQTAAKTFTGRTITGTANQVSVSNGDGIAGNPTLSTPQNIHTAATPQFAGLGIGVASGATGLKLVDGSVVYPSADSTTAIKFAKSDGSTVVMTIDTSNAWVGVGSTPGALFHVKGPNFPPIRAERTVSNTDSTWSGVQLLATTSGDMVDGFGTQFVFSIQDDAGVINNICSIGAVRDGSDTQGALRFVQSTSTEMARISYAGNFLLGATAAGTSAAKVIGIANGTAPSTSPADMVQLYAEDVAASSELKVRDEASNITTLSPHNFSVVGGPSEPMAWSYYSRRHDTEINVDMLRVIRAVERLTGERFVAIRKGA